MTAIFKKEIRTYFTTMTGYIFLGFLVLLTALFFSLGNVLSQSADYAQAISNPLFLFLFLLILIPTLTMRLFADETRQKTDQLLYTSPLTVNQIVIGKFLAAFVLFMIGIAITGLFPLIMSRFGEISKPQTFGVLIGFCLLGMSCISVGLFIAALTNNQIVAAIVSGVIFVAMQLIDYFAASMPKDRVSSIIFIIVIAVVVALVLYDSTKSIIATLVFCLLCVAGLVVIYFTNKLLLDGVITKSLNWFSILSRFENFTAGILNLSDIVYYLTFSATFVYLTTNIIEKRRWK